MGIILVVFAVALLIMMVAYVFHQKRERTASLRAHAEASGYDFEPEVFDSLETRYAGVGLFGRGRNRHGSNLMKFREGELRFRMFDYSFYEGTRSNESHRTFSVVLAETGWRLRRLQVRPEGFLDGLAKLVGAEDLQLDSVEFNQRFLVETPHPGWATELLHPKMMDYLLQAPPCTIEIVGDTVVFYVNYHLDSPGYLLYLAHLKKFIRLIPEELRVDPHAEPSD